MRHAALPAADPRLSLAVALALMGAALGAPRASVTLWLSACSLAVLVSTAGRAAPWRTLSSAWGLGAGAALLRIWLSGEPPVEVVHPLGLALRLSRPAVEQGALILSRVLATTLAAAWLSATTSARGLAAALAWARCPLTIVDLLLLSSRYRHVLGEAVTTIRSAQAMRLGYADRRRSLRSAGALIGALTCRAVDQATATADAMLLRGDSGAVGLRVPGSSARANRRLLGAGALALGGAVLLWSAPW